MPDTVDHMDEALRALRIDPERRRRGRRRSAWLRYGVLALVGLAIAGYFFSRTGLNPVEVEVAATQRLDPGPTLVLTGVATSSRTAAVELAPKITGRVEGSGGKGGHGCARAGAAPHRAAGIRGRGGPAQALLAGARARCKSWRPAPGSEEIERPGGREEARSDIANAVLDLERFERLHADGRCRGRPWTSPRTDTR
jgi:hypothetical protein